MVKIRFLQPDGTELAIDAEVGCSVMEIAVKNRVVGIIGECGGYCACGTCLAWIDPKFLPLLAEPQEAEADMLAFVDPQELNGRLMCQVRVCEEMDGMLVTTRYR